MDGFIPSDVLDPLQEANRGLGEALKSPNTPLGGRASLLRSSAYRLREALEDHIRETEAPRGFLAEMQQRAPRLTPKVTGLCAEHDMLHAEIEALIELLLSGTSAQDLEAARAVARRLRGEIRAHQDHANDLFFQAYCTDIGPCD